MVGLGAAGGEDHVGPPGLCVRQQKLQLADLVAAKPHADQVIPLDIDIFFIFPAQVLQLVQGRGPHGQMQPGKIMDRLHGTASFKMLSRYQHYTREQAAAQGQAAVPLEFSL